jgi:hypothetical protein
LCAATAASAAACVLLLLVLLFLLSFVCRLDLKKCHKELQTLEKALPLDGK